MFAELGRKVLDRILIQNTSENPAPESDTPNADIAQSVAKSMKTNRIPTAVHWRR